MKLLASLVLAGTLTAFAVPSLAPALAQGTPAAAPAATRGPIIRAGATRKISDHVSVIEDMSAPGVPNVGFIVGDKAVLVVDTGMGRKNGETVLAEARKLAGAKKIYLVTTHVHPEHDLGAQAFPADAVLVRSTAQVGEIAEEGMKTADAFRSRSEINKQLLDGAEFRKANETFATTKDIDLGGVTAKLIAVGPSHTQGDTAIFVDKDAVLFSGDLAMKAPPAFSSSKSSVKTWLASLDKVEALKARIVVPSHGPLGDNSYITGYRTYMAKIQKRAGELKKSGKSLEEATTTIEAELKPDYPNTTRVAGAVKAAYAEAG